MSSVLSMRDLERRTDAAYEEVSDAHVTLKLRHEDVKRFQLFTAITLSLVALIVVGLFVLGPWFAALAPLGMFFTATTVVIRRLHWLRNDELPRLMHRYHERLTAATEALQRQEDRRTLGLFDPKEYARIEREVQLAKDEALQRQQEEELWENAFHNVLNNPYRWL